MAGIGRSQAIVNRAVLLTPKLGQKAALLQAIKEVYAAPEAQELAKKIFKKILIVTRKQGNPLVKTRNKK